MVIKVYVSGISASKEVKKKQQRAILMLDSFNLNYEAIDITEPGREEERVTAQLSFKNRNSDKRTPLPPQFFNDDDYCGDYEDFNAAVDVDQLFSFLKLEELNVSSNGINGINDNQDTSGVSRDNGEEDEIEGEKNKENILGNDEKNVEIDETQDAEAILEKEIEMKQQLKDADKEIKERSAQRNDATKTENEEMKLSIDESSVKPTEILANKAKDESEEEKDDDDDDDEEVESEEESPKINKDNIAEKALDSNEKPVENKKDKLELVTVNKKEEDSDEEELESEESDEEELESEESDDDLKEKVSEKEPSSIETKEKIDEITKIAQVKKQQQESEEETDDEESED